MMNIYLWSIGKWKSPHYEALVADYMQRLSHYFEGNAQLFKSEAKVIDALEPSDYVLACDERGKQYNSREFASFIEKRRDSAVRRLIVYVGDATGLTPAVKERANSLWSFSHQTFPHELALVVAAEQLYRAATILRGEKYHYG
jgi:23S rRNA (pseudouridine1915-N3)-methyltransferase